MGKIIKESDPRVSSLRGKRRPWWDVNEKKFISSATLYIAFGCPDWGEKNGARNNLCTFCAIPNAVIAYRDAFYEGVAVPLKDHIEIFKSNLKNLMREEKNLHTLMIFNAGSFLAMDESLQKKIVSEIAAYGSIKRVVIESRAELITEDSVAPLIHILGAVSKFLTIRIGVETLNDHLRLKILRKGHSRKQLHHAMSVMKKYGITSGGYALLKPAPSESLKIIMENPQASEDEVIQWTIQETSNTLDWILGGEENQLGMDEAYYCSTNVGPNTLLEKSWRQGDFTPATLWMVYTVLQSSIVKHKGRVHLLSFSDEPQFLAVPSNHVEKGIGEDLGGAQGCDLIFHEMFNNYRLSMDPHVLKPPLCSCRPNWVDL